MANSQRPGMSHTSQTARESSGTERGQPDDSGLIAESCRVPSVSVRCSTGTRRRSTAISRWLGRDAADDLVAETFLVAFRQRGGYDQDQPSARPWLYGIATRLISRRRREEVRFFRAIARTGIDPVADPVAEPVADEGVRRADARRLHRRRAGALAGLSTAPMATTCTYGDGFAIARPRPHRRALGAPRRPRAAARPQALHRSAQGPSHCEPQRPVGAPARTRRCQGNPATQAAAAGELARLRAD